MKGRQPTARSIRTAIGASIAAFLTCCLAIMPAYGSDSLVGDAPRSGADIDGPKSSPPAGFNVATGPGYVWNRQIGSAYSHWLGALDVGNGSLEYCINLDSMSPAGAGELVTSAKPAPAPGVLGDLTVSNAQMGYIFKTFGGVNDATTRAALSFLVHANYEQGGGRTHVQRLILDVMESSDPSIRTRAKAMVAEAQNSGVQEVVPGEIVVGPSKMDFELNGLGVKDKAGNWIEGVDFTVTISKGQALFSNGKNSVTMTSKSTPLSLSGKSTGNSEVEVSYKFHWKEAAVALRERLGSQTTLVPGTDTPRTFEGKHKTFSLIYDFQPILVSNTAESHVLAPNAQVATDYLDVMADSSYANPKWTEIDGKPVPVSFEGALYHLGALPAPAVSGEVPSSAKVIGSTSFVAEGPGRYNASIDVPSDLQPGALYWQWTVTKSKQGSWAKYIHADWSDSFGLEDEHSYKPYVVQLDTSISAKLTKNGLYMLDDVFIDGLPEDYPSFSGGSGYGADSPHITQTGLFFEGKKKGEVVESDRAEATVVCNVELPAKNGYYASIGSTDCKWPQNSAGEEIPGVFAWIHSHEGSDRVEGFTTSVEDVTEQHEVVAASYSVITKAQKEVLLGETATDTAVVTGTVPNGTTLTFTAYKEAYDESGLPICGKDNEIGQVQYGVISAAGEYTSPPIALTQEALDAHGDTVARVWWVESTSNSETGKVAHVGECGLPNETTKVIPYDPNISTKAQADGALVVGGKIRDTLSASWALPEGFSSTAAPSVTPWPYPVGSKTEVALYYAAPGQELTCSADQLLGTDTVELVEGKTEYETRYWTVDKPGTFGFVETTRPPRPAECEEGDESEGACEERVISQGECADPDETLTVELPLTPPETLAKTGAGITISIAAVLALSVAGSVLLVGRSRGLRTEMGSSKPVH